MPGSLDEEIEDALAWALESVIGARRKTSQSLLSQTPGGRLDVHEYILDADTRDQRDRVPDAVWRAALDAAAAGTGRRFAVGIAAAVQDEPAGPRRMATSRREAGNTGAMYNLGVLLKTPTPGRPGLVERAAKPGKTGAMNNLGLLLEDADPARPGLVRAGSRGRRHHGHHQPGACSKTATPRQPGAGTSGQRKPAKPRP